jgi:hypothetical protein
MLMEKGGVCLFDNNLREVNVSFKTRGSVSVILVNLKGGVCNFPLNLIVQFLWLTGEGLN